MKKLVLFALFSAATAMAQVRTETIPFRVNASSLNEVPALPAPNSAANVTVLMHLSRNEAGEVVGGAVDFRVRYRLGQETTITMMHIHRGAAGVNGPVVIDSGLPGRVENTQNGALNTQGVLPKAAETTALIKEILANPAGFYVNMHTERAPGGEVRGQLMPAEEVVLMGLMSPLNEAPPITNLNASGIGAVTVRAARLPNGQIASAEVIFDAAYSGFAEGTTFTGFHIHYPAPAGSNAGVTINTGLSGVPAAASGGTLHYEVDADPGVAAQQATLQALLADPSLAYINLHTQANPGGAIRAQLHRTDSMSFDVSASPANEVPAITGLDAKGWARFTAHSLRNNEGWAVAAFTVFDVNHEFPENTQFTGMHLHNAPAGSNGGVVIDSRLAAANQPASASGRGNIYRAVIQTTSLALGHVNGVGSNPADYYFNLHTTSNPSGAVRAQLRAPLAAPSIIDVYPANSYIASESVAPLGLMTIYGKNLFPATAGSDSFESAAPLSINGVKVTVGGRSAALLTLGRDPNDYIVAQVPADAVTGSQPVVVEHAGGASAPMNVRVEAVAPALYFDSAGAIAYRVSDMSLIRPESPAFGGEPIAILVTGMGQTLPALRTGQFPSLENPSLVLRPVTVTIGGRSAAVTATTAVPGFPGFYIVIVTAPAGISGSQPVAIRVGEAAANIANLAIR
ncbi:MAG: CHRD domain-containing protein [Bryobacteraceae bacterium]|nr:CHRD domain-containing protein [Bryobacteraceae bacterium]